MEYWVHSCSIWLKNNTVHGINKLIPITLIQTLKLFVFDHDSNIPSFHVGGIKPVSLKTA
jgi:hypothetical protein